MTPFVIGSREDVAGFALAGIDGVACATRDEADAALARAGADALIIMSAEFVRAATSGALIVALPPRM
jgi:vacuolar-type H+-ATPase subunit F/Vma7